MCASLGHWLLFLFPVVDAWFDALTGAEADEIAESILPRIRREMMRSVRGRSASSASRKWSLEEKERLYELRVRRSLALCAAELTIPSPVFDALQCSRRHGCRGLSFSLRIAPRSARR